MPAVNDAVRCNGRVWKDGRKPMEDAQVLAELCEIVKQNRELDFGRIIMDKASYPYLYHLSEIRQNLVDCLPIRKGMRVLELNPEGGALTVKLLKMGANVTCIAENDDYAHLIETRYQKGFMSELRILHTFWDIEGLRKTLSLADMYHKYDVILIAGNFYRFYEVLPELGGLLETAGRLYVADANRLGLKYMAGCQEEYRGGYFAGVEGYPSAYRDGYVTGDEGIQKEEQNEGQTDNHRGAAQGRCYTRQEYTRLLRKAGFSDLEFYYPYPDFKFPSCIYSEERLPEKGELADNRRNFERDRYQIFDERRVYDTLLEEQLFGEFSNSFLIEARVGRGDMKKEPKTIYAKYSNERAAQFSICTSIARYTDGKRKVYKYALSKEGLSHITHIVKAYGWLEKAYASAGIGICPCAMQGEVVGFSYIEGHSLQEEMELAVKNEDMQTVRCILQEYIRRISADGGEEPFRITEEFIRVFGEQTPEEGAVCAKASDIDMIFSNILFADGNAWDPDTKWNVIDYEWTFDFPVPKAFILYRAMYFAYYQILNDTAIQLSELMELAGITTKQAKVFAAMEEHFQTYIGKGTLPMRNMQRMLGTKIHMLENALGKGYHAALGEEVFPESEWVKVRKLMYHIDREEFQDGSVICCGWAAAKAKDGRYLPVNIYVTDADGKRVPAEISRLERRDVAEVLRIRSVSNPIWGFDCVWIAPPMVGWKIHFTLGGCEKIHEALSLKASESRG